jgi:hypothetical protein
MEKLQELSARMDLLEESIENLKASGNMPDDCASLQKELRDLMLMTHEDPLSLRRRVKTMQKRLETLNGTEAHVRRFANLEIPQGSRYTAPRSLSQATGK